MGRVIAPFLICYKKELNKYDFVILKQCFGNGRLLLILVAEEDY
jgi:hypothetical protein